LKKREKTVKDLKEGIELYSEVARAFLLRCIKNVLINMIKDEDLDLDILEDPISE